MKANPNRSIGLSYPSTTHNSNVQQVGNSNKFIKS